MSTAKKSGKSRRASGQTTLTISLPEDLKQAIEGAAADAERSTSNYLVVEIRKLLEARQGK